MKFLLLLALCLSSHKSPLKKDKGKGYGKGFSKGKKVEGVVRFQII